ncbi:MAG: carbonic anhydrase [Myxococcota bacterium]|nr:carbonic anhydrase [Myxococcota bacterium]
MSAASLTCLPGNRLIMQLEDRRSRRGLDEVRCLFITCEEEVGLVKSPHESRVPGALCLGTPGASVDDPDLVEAIRYAVEELGAERVVVAAHSLCDHIAEEMADATEPQGAGGEIRIDDWLGRRVRRVNQLMDAARDRVRHGVWRLASNPKLADLGVPITGVVRAVESGVYYAYYRDRDEFEALL